jgi:eukaryotic-like serine/threonine-protein kinase
MQKSAVEICRRIGASLDRHLGSGAFKDAFLVTVGSDRLALKLAELTDSQRLQREIAALQSCCHPAIANLRAVQVEVVDDVTYLVIVEEYLSGGTLEQRLRQSVLSPLEIRELGLALASALAHLHERSLVHRDIKPANILFRNLQEPVLSDFGIVRILGEPSLTHDFIPQGPGTPLYAAPEQLTNSKALIDWRTDQFGLALVLAECVLRRPAFAEVGQTPRDAVDAVARHSPLPASSCQSLEAAGFGVLIKALSPWPIGRFRQPSDFLAALAEE